MSVRVGYWDYLILKLAADTYHGVYIYLKGYTFYFIWCMVLLVIAGWLWCSCHINHSNHVMHEIYRGVG
jgi:hypothetical protein